MRFPTLLIVAVALLALVAAPLAIAAASPSTFGEAGQAIASQLDDNHQAAQLEAHSEGHQPADLARYVAAVLGFMAAGVGMALSLKDASLKNTKALPTGAATIVGAGFDLGHGSKGDMVAQCELQIEAPALAVGELPDTETVIYHAYHSDASDYAGETLLYGNVITQTGAGGAGAAAVTKQLRLPVDVKRYVRIKAVKSDATDASAKSMVTRLVF